MVTLLLSTLTLVACSGHTVGLVQTLVLPDSPLAVAFDVRSHRVGNEREFVVSVADTLVGGDPPSTYYVVGGRKGRQEISPVRNGKNWVVTVREPVGEAWAVLVRFLGPHVPVAPTHSEMDVFVLPLAAFVPLDHDERAALRAAKGEALLYDAPHSSEMAYRTGLMDLKAVASLQMEEPGKTRVVFCDGSKALVPLVGDR